MFRDASSVVLIRAVSHHGLAPIDLYQKLTCAFGLERPAAIFWTSWRSDRLELSDCAAQTRLEIGVNDMVEETACAFLRISGVPKQGFVYCHCATVKIASHPVLPRYLLHFSAR